MVGNDVKLQQVLKTLEKGKVSFLKAAQMAGVSVWSLLMLCEKKGWCVRHDKFMRKDIEKALEW